MSLAWPVLNAARNYGLPGMFTEMDSACDSVWIRDRLNTGRLIPFHLTSVEAMSNGITRGDIPDSRAPYPMTWNEFSVPGDTSGRRLEVGVLTRVFPKPAFRRLQQIAEATGHFPMCTDWVCDEIIMMAVFGHVLGRPIPIVVELFPVQGGAVVCSHSGTVIPPAHLEDLPQVAVAAAETAATIILFAWALLACRNVDTREVHPSTRRADRRTSPDRVVYRELVVRAAPPRLSMTRDAEKLRGVAFHLVRGHFKEYGNKGLFGRLKGRWWFGPHTAGTVEYGTVLKNYSFPGEQTK